MKKIFSKLFVFSAFLLVGILLFTPLLNMNLRANTLNLAQGYLFLERMEVDTATDMIVMFTPSTDFDNVAEDRVLRIFFPEGETADTEWCLDHVDGILTITGVGAGESPIDIGDWSIDEALPAETALEAVCHQGSGVNESDYIEISDIDSLVADTSYGFKIDSDDTVFKTGPNDEDQLVSFQLIEGMKVETISFSIALIDTDPGDQVVVTADVSDFETITCTVQNEVNLGTLFLGGAYVTSSHEFSTDSTSGFYWAVYGQGNEGVAGLFKDDNPPNEAPTYLISSEGNGDVVNLATDEGFGLVVSAITVGEVQPNYVPGGGLFGAIKTTPSLILASDSGGSDTGTVILGARASSDAEPGTYEETLTYVCGGYVGTPIVE